MLRSTLLFLLVFGVPLAIAQTPNPYNGTWVVSFDGKSTADLEGKVIVTDGGGTWKVLARSTKNPCIGREAPITLQSSSVDELVIEVNRSKVLSGCKDFTFRFKKIDDKTLEGKLSDGRAMTLTKE